MPEENDWQPDTSDLVSDYEGLVIAAHFDESQYGCQLTLELSTDIPEKPDWKEFFRVGKDWHTLDGGDTVTHRDKSKFNKNSQYFQFFTKAAQLAPELQGRGSTKTASIWVGTKWYWEAVSNPYKLEDGREGVSIKNYPSKFLGFGDAGVIGDNGEVANPTSVLAGLTDTTMTTMSTLAKELTHNEWVDKVMDIDEVVKDSKVVSALVDTSPDGLYERLRNE